METNLLERPVTGSTVLSLMPTEPEANESWGWRFAVSATAPHWARYNTKWFLERCQSVSESLNETAIMLVSELVTNAYTATTNLSDATSIDLSLRLFGDHLLIEIIDSSPDIPVQSHPADPSAEHGRGLGIVNALSQEWGYFWHHGRKVVYCILPLQTRVPRALAAPAPKQPAS